jgi:hypothetical protein
VIIASKMLPQLSANSLRDSLNNAADHIKTGAKVHQEVVGEWTKKQMNRAKFIIRQVSMAAGGALGEDHEEAPGAKNARMFVYPYLITDK